MNIIDKYIFTFYIFIGSSCLLFGFGYLYIGYRIYNGFK